MTAHAPRLTAPLDRSTLRRRPRVPRLGRRTVIVLLLAACVLAIMQAPSEVAAAAHATCTIGEPAGTTCGEAMVHVGYP